MELKELNSDMKTENLIDIDDLELIFDNLKTETIYDDILIAIYYLTKIKKKKGVTVQDIRVLYDIANKDEPTNLFVYLNRMKVRKLILRKNDLHRLDRKGRDRISELFTESNVSVDSLLKRQLPLSKEISSEEIPPKQKSDFNYIDLKDEILPDKFYIKLRNQINKAYNYEILLAVQILCRKFLENLIIDILIFKYKEINIDLFYNTKFGKHHIFNTLIQNFENKLEDFKLYIPTLDKSFIKRIGKYKQQANATAHSIIIDIRKKDLDKDKQNLENIISILIKLREFVKA